MGGRIKLWLFIQVTLVTALLIGSLTVALSYGGGGVEAARGPLMLFALFGSLGFAVVAVFFWRGLVRGLLRPQEVLAREVRTLTQAKQLDRPLRLPEGQRLGELTGAAQEMIDELHRARREAVRAMATATARVEQEKGWLEMILLELVPNGVVVCSLDHRILLYNRPAARLFHFSHALGLGRSLFDLVAGEPVRHALERLQYRLQSAWQDVSPPFVCASRDARLMLKARLALILDQERRPTGYVLSLEDLSAQLVELQRSAARQRAVTRDMRGPLGSLRAAAENLAAFPDLDQEHRQVFQQIVLNETGVLSQQIEKLTLAWADSSASRSGERWLMAEIHSPDLFGCVARQLEEGGIPVAVAGEPHWLKGDSYSLVQVLVQLIRRLSERSNSSDFVLEAGLSQSRAYLELRWQGKPAGSSELNGWLETPLPTLAGLTGMDVLERHESEPWSRQSPEGTALLRIPLLAPPEPEAARETQRPPPRPEFYDFNLMDAQNAVGALAERALEDLNFVVFDTETTGLRPTQGDEIISIAAVRVTKGRVLTGETFDQLINPGRSIPKDSIRFHGITDEMVQGQPPIEQVLPRFHEFVGDGVMVAHNAAFDMKFLKLKEARCGVSFGNPVMDTLLLSLLVEGESEDHSLDGICERLNITVASRHSALADALATGHVLVHLLERLKAMDIHTFAQAMQASSMEAQLHFRAAHF